VIKHKTDEIISLCKSEISLTKKKRQPLCLVGRETVAKVSVLKHKTAFKGK